MKRRRGSESGQSCRSSFMLRLEYIMDQCSVVSDVWACS